MGTLRLLIVAIPRLHHGCDHFKADGDQHSHRFEGKLLPEIWIHPPLQALWPCCGIAYSSFIFLSVLQSGEFFAEEINSSRMSVFQETHISDRRCSYKISFDISRF